MATFIDKDGARTEREVNGFASGIIVGGRDYQVAVCGLYLERGLTLEHVESSRTSLMSHPIPGRSKEAVKAEVDEFIASDQAMIVCVLGARYYTTVTGLSEAYETISYRATVVRRKG